MWHTWHRMSHGAPDKEPHAAKVLLLKSACFDSSFESTCHVCLHFPWMSRCGLFSRGQFEPVKAGHFGTFLTADQAGRLISSVFCLFQPLPFYSGGERRKGLRVGGGGGGRSMVGGGAAVTAKPDVGRVYCFAIKSNAEKKKRNMQSEREL